MKVLITKIVELSEDDLEGLLLTYFPENSDKELEDKILGFYDGETLTSQIGSLSETTFQLIRTKH